MPILMASGPSQFDSLVRVVDGDGEVRRAFILIKLDCRMFYFAKPDSNINT